MDQPVKNNGDVIEINRVKDAREAPRQVIRNILSAMQKPELSTPMQDAIVAMRQFRIGELRNAMDAMLLEVEAEEKCLLAYFYIHLVEKEGLSEPAILAEQAAFGVLRGTNENHRRMMMVLLTQLQQPCESLKNAFKELMCSADWDTQVCAAANLCDDTDSIFILSKALRGDDPMHIALAAGAFAKVQVRHEEAVQALIQALEVPDPHVQLIVLRTIGSLGEKAAAAKDALEKLLLQPSLPSMTWHAVLLGLEQIDKSGDPVKLMVRTLQLAIRQSNWLAASLAFVTLKHADPYPEAALTELTNLLDSEVELARGYAVETLGELGLVAVSAIPELLKLVRRERSKKVINSLITTLGKIGKAAVPGLLEIVAEDDAQTCGVATATVAEIAENAVEEVVTLAFHHAEPSVRNLGIAMLRMMGPQAVSGVKILREVLRDEPAGKQLEALAALSDIGPESLEAMPELLAVLGSDDMDIRNWASRVIIRIGPRAIPFIEDRLDTAQPVELERLQLILQQMGYSSSPSERKDIWQGKERFLQLFVAMGRLLEESSAISYLDMAADLKAFQASGWYSELKSSAANLRKTINQLNELFTAETGREIHLLEKQSTKKSKLSKDGKEYFQRICDYLDQRGMLPPAPDVN